MSTIGAFIDAYQYLQSNPSDFIEKVIVQLQLSMLGLLIAIIIAIPLGVFSAKYEKVSTFMIQTSNTVRVIPSLAVLAIMIPYVGTGFLPSLIALIILAIPTILINTYTGFLMVSREVKESALAMGMEPRSILLSIEFPLALPVIIAGCKTAAVQVIAASTLAAFIGGGGLGEYILLGVGMNELSFILLGTLPIAGLSLSAEYILEWLENHFVTS